MDKPQAEHRLSRPLSLVFFRMFPINHCLELSDFGRADIIHDFFASSSSVPCTWCLDQSVNHPLILIFRGTHSSCHLPAKDGGRAKLPRSKAVSSAGRAFRVPPLPVLMDLMSSLMLFSSSSIFFPVIYDFVFHPAFQEQYFLVSSPKPDISTERGSWTPSSSPLEPPFVREDPSNHKISEVHSFLACEKLTGSPRPTFCFLEPGPPENSQASTLSSHFSCHGVQPRDWIGPRCSFSI